MVTRERKGAEQQEDGVKTPNLFPETFLPFFLKCISSAYLSKSHDHLQVKKERTDKI